MFPTHEMPDVSHSAPISKGLLDLATDPNRRPKISRMRDVIEEIEAALAAGITYQEVVERLGSLGLELTHPTFASYLKRIRAERSRTRASSSTSGASPSEATRASAARPETHADSPSPPSSVSASTWTPSPQSARPDNQPGSHDPESLNQIMRSNPDLEKYAKLGRNFIKGQKK